MSSQWKAQKRLGGISLILIPVVLVVVCRPARAGFCAGDRDRARVVLEQLGFRLDRWLSQALTHGTQAARTGFNWAARLALHQIRQESRESLLMKVKPEPPDAGALGKLLMPFWQRAGAIRSLLFGEPGNIHEEMDTSVDRALAGWSTCRAVQKGDHQPCALIASADLQAECMRITLRFGIFYQHRCGEEAIRTAATVRRAPAEHLKAYCEALAHQQPHRCTRIPGIPDPVRVNCQALAGKGKSACGVLPEQDRQGCITEWTHYLYVRGQMSFWHWLPDQESPLVVIGAQVARGHIDDCRQAMAKAYDAASSVYFMSEGSAGR